MADDDLDTEGESGVWLRWPDIGEADQSVEVPGPDRGGEEAQTESDPLTDETNDTFQVESEAPPAEGDDDLDTPTTPRREPIGEATRALAEEIDRLQAKRVDPGSYSPRTADYADPPEGDLPSWMTKPRPASSTDEIEGSSPSTEHPDAAPLPVRPGDLSAGRIDNVPAAIGALSMRIDSLLAATTTYRSVLSDRLAEYADLVNRLNRTHASDIDEFRKSNERTVGSIRKTLADLSDEARTAATQTEMLLTDVGSLDDHIKNHSADGRELLEASDKLGRFVTEALDRFAERVLAELSSLSQAVNPELGSMRSEVGLLRESIDDLNERSSQAPVREAIDELRGDMSGLRRAVLDWPDLEITRSEVVAMRADLTALLEASELADDDGQGLLERTAIDARKILDELTAARAELASVIDDDSSDAMDEVTGELRILNEAVARTVTHDELTAAITNVTAPPETDPFESLHIELDALRSRLAELPDVEQIRSEAVAAALEAAKAVSPPDTLAADLADLKSNLLDLRSAVNSAADSTVDLDAFRAALDERFAALPEPVVPEMPAVPTADDIVARIDEVIGTRFDNQISEVVSPEEFEKVTTQLAALASRISDLPTAERIRSDLVAAAMDAVTAASPAGDILEQVADLHSDMTALRTTLLERITALEPDRTDDRLGTLSEQVGELRSTVASLSSTIPEAIESAVAAPGASALTPLVSELSQVRSELADVRAGLDDVRSTAADRSEQEVDLSPLLTEIRSTMGAAGSDVASIDDRIAPLAEQVDGLRAVVLSMQEHLPAMIEAAGTPLAPAPDFSPITEQLGGEIASLREQMSGLTKHVASLAERAPTEPVTSPIGGGGVSDEAIAALRDEVRALRRRIKVRLETDD